MHDQNIAQPNSSGEMVVRLDGPAGQQYTFSVPKSISNRVCCWAIGKFYPFEISRWN